VAASASALTDGLWVGPRVEARADGRGASTPVPAFRRKSAVNCHFKGGRVIKIGAVFCALQIAISTTETAADAAAVISIADAAADGRGAVAITVGPPESLRSAAAAAAVRRRLK